MDKDELKKKLYASNVKEIKDALDVCKENLVFAEEYFDRIEELRHYAENNSGMAAVQLETAAIEVWCRVQFSRKNRDNR